MGIAPYIAEAVIREHKYRPIRDEVLLLGRQTFLITPEHAIDMLRAHGIEPSPLDLDESAIDHTTRAGANRGYITDTAFFRLLGARTVRALDVTDYEGAEILHDLNKPIPDELEDIADFILDGSTLDNLFNPAAAMQSVTRMLRSGGRFIATNMASPHASPYTMLTPYWFADYFAINRFEDARVYITSHGYFRGEMDVLAVGHCCTSGRSFYPQQAAGLVVFGGKGASTTWDEFPCQRNYAGPHQMAQYMESETRFMKSLRPELLMSNRESGMGYSLFRSLVEHYRSVTHAQYFKFVGADGQRRDVKSPLMMRFREPLRRLFGV
jgi:hypothetical protein